MARSLSLLLMTLLMVPLLANADDEAGKSTLRADDVNPKTNSIPNSEEIDELITNKNLRAYSGSTSRWSISSAFNYNGGTVKTPLSQDRPNISEASATTAKADLDGNVSAKFNINVKNSLMAGVGVRWIAPFEKNSPKEYDGTRFDVQNPFIQHQFIYNWGVQSVLQTGFMQWTQADSTAIGYDKQISIDQENMYEVGKTGLSIGASVWGNYTLFNKSGPHGNPADKDNYIADLKSVQADWQFGLAPDLEYELTDSLNLRTIVTLWVFEHYRDRAANTFFHDKTYQSIGVGYSATRDIFIYPNIQFLPDKMAANLTNVGVQATINLF